VKQGRWFQSGGFLDWGAGPWLSDNQGGASAGRKDTCLACRAMLSGNLAVCLLVRWARKILCGDNDGDYELSMSGEKWLRSIHGDCGSGLEAESAVPCRPGPQAIGLGVPTSVDLRARSSRKPGEHLLLGLEPNPRFHGRELERKTAGESWSGDWPCSRSLRDFGKSMGLPVETSGRAKAAGQVEVIMLSDRRSGASGGKGAERYTIEVREGACR